MKAFAILLTAAVVASAVAFPAEEKTKKSQAELRASLITKDNIAEYMAKQREQKALKQLPEPFVVSTSLNVQGENNNQRRGRTYFDKDGSTVVVEGVRMRDDPSGSDRVTWRNGRVINNVFVPADGFPVPEETRVSSRQPKAFNFDDFYRGQKPLLPDNMAVESRSDHGVFVEAPEQFKV